MKIHEYMNTKKFNSWNISLDFMGLDFMAHEIAMEARNLTAKICAHGYEKSEINPNNN